MNDVQPLDASIDLDAELLALAESATAQPVAG